MFEFRQLEVVHWDFWERFEIPLNTNIITVIGPNGSGKTTLLDAFRVLLTIECSSGRDYKRYVRRNNQAYLRAVVGNRADSTGRHPFFPHISEEITLLCRIRKKAGDWQRQYLILEGNVALEDLEEKPDWLGVREYSRRLESAGLTQAIKRVLALEQGDTDKLCEFTQKALLNLVFDVFGDKEALDNYQQAKTEQYEISRELEELQTKLASMRAQLHDAESQVNNYNEWQRLSQEVTRLESETLAQVELSQQLTNTQQIMGQLGTLRSQRDSSGDRFKEFDGHIRSTRKEIENIDALLNDIQAANKATNEEFLQIRDKTRAAEHTLAERDRLIKLGEASSTGIDIKSIQCQQEKAYQKLSDLRQQRQHFQQTLTELRAQQQVLHTGKQLLPENVVTMSQALLKHNIEHTLLSEIIEIKDKHWQPAIEGLLRPYRYLVLLEEEKERERAWKLGQQMRYPHFIVGEREEKYPFVSGTILNEIEFLEAPPAWMPDFLAKVFCVDNVNKGSKLGRGKQWITPDGYFCERRGARHIGVDERQFCYGHATRLRQAEHLTKEILANSTALEQASNDIQLALKEIAERESLLKDVDSSKTLQARAIEFAEAEQQLPSLQNEAHAVSLKLAELQQQHHDQVEAKHALDKQLARYETQLGELKNSEQSSVYAEKQLQEKLVKCILAFRRKRHGMPPEWRTPEMLAAVIAEYPDTTHVKHESDRVRRQLETGIWITDESVLNRRDKVKSDVDILDQDIKNRSAHHYRLCRITDDARESYINVLRATVRVYSKNLRTLGGLAGIDVEVTPPVLENDDLILAQAGLHVRFNFDQKGMIGLNDGEASGGQQVMKSLILLVALMMDEQNNGGFVFIDEPFAHLDIFNIDKVGAFLESTQAQYVLTTPNTHNINIFNPTGLTLVTQKRKPNARWAAPIAFVQRLPTPESDTETEAQSEVA